MEGRLLGRAREELSRRRDDNKREESRRRQEIAGKYPEIRRINAQLLDNAAALAGMTLSGDGKGITELEKSSVALLEKRQALLLRYGYPGSYLDEIVSCPLCGDSGYRDGRNCDCLLTLYRQEQTKELAPLLRQGSESFENFRTDYYSTVPQSDGRPSPRAQMQRVLGLCRDYADKLGTPAMGGHGRNLLFTGAPGLGKTFLSGCIARAGADKGLSVAYDTATGLLSAFQSERFGTDDAEREDGASRVRQLKGCDLLILDDLGTEMLTAFSQSALYDLLDGRLRRGLCTVISTNLEKDALTERYGAALGSRLSGEYLWLAFLGSDIRGMRKGKV